MHDWLYDDKNGKWLLILDNIDDAHFLTETGDRNSQPLLAYLPQSENGRILITTRSKGIALKLVEEREIIAVEPMAESHAITLFEKKLGVLGDSNDIAQLVAALEFMPLAIVQAAAYISQRAPRCSVLQYLQNFRKSDYKKTSLLDNDGGHLRRDQEATNSIIITWHMSFQHIHQTKSSAADLLSLMSFFDRQCIPAALIRTRVESQSGYGSQKKRVEHDGEEYNEDSSSEFTDNDEFEDNVLTLRNYSFIYIDTDQTFKMHTLVQLAMRKWLEASRQLEYWKQKYITILSAAFPIGEYENWTKCQSLFPHANLAITQRPKVDSSLKEWVSLLYNLAWYSLEKGNLKEAESLSKMAMETRRTILGREHETTLASTSLLGSAYQSKGQWGQAQKLYEKVMETSKKVLDLEHPDTIATMNNLASTIKKQGR